VSDAFAGKVVLVTGASRGLGRAAAIALGTAGAHVVAVARTVGGLEEVDDAIKAAGGSASLVPLDLTDGAAIDRLGGVIFERWGRLDALLANAGQLGTITPLSHLDIKVWDATVAINLTTNWRLIRSFDPLLRRAEAGRALFVTSGAAHHLRPFWGVYSVTKAGLEALVRTYAGEIAHTKARANLIDPGAMRTAMRAKAMPGEDPAAQPEPSVAVPKILEMLSPSFTDNGVLYDLRAGGYRVPN
jgi:NAD(P)-dependent dehydrogenase (short-subunit alcohol dehydrogenase family)